MRRYSGWLWKGLLLPACIAYSLMVHSVLLHAHGSGVRLAVAAVPLLLFAYWVGKWARHKRAWTGLLFALTVVIYFIERQEGLGVAAANAITHAAINLLLACVFGRTLLGSEEPLVTRFARRVHGTLPVYMEAYTRRVTAAWCAFFVAQIVISGILLVSAPLQVWSFFVNVLSLPLVALFFIAEYLYRVTRYRDYPHSSIIESIQVFAEHAATEGRPAARAMPGKASENACG
jgi:uncharacterized membrane protein